MHNSEELLDTPSLPPSPVYKPTRSRVLGCLPLPLQSLSDPIESPPVSSPVLDEERVPNHMMCVKGIFNHDLVMISQQLPPEIVLRILDLANAPSSDPKLLQSCSLVCKAWSTHAQKFFFRSVSISTHRGYTALVSAFQPYTPHRSNTSEMMRGSHTMISSPISFIPGFPNLLPTLGFAYSNFLRGSVIELNMIIDFGQHDGLTFTELSRIVPLCPNIRKVGISVFGSHSPGRDTVGAANQWRMRRLAPLVPDRVLQELRTAPGAFRISGLRLNDWSDNLEALIQILPTWPRVTSLKIAGKLPTVGNGIDSVSSTVPPDAAPRGLETLSLNCTTGAESNVDFVKWLLVGSQHTLRRLEFLREPSGKLLEDIFDRSVFPLESVYLPSCASSAVGQIIQRRLGSTVIPTFDGDGEVDGDHAFVHVQGLKELFVEDPSTPLKFLLSVVRSETVQSFGFGVNGHTDLSSISRAIKAQTGLKRIAVLICDGGGRGLRLGGLRIVCAIRGIEFEETRDVKEFRAWKA